MSTVSIIMPTYKGSDKILLPLYGAMQQTWQDTEIIVVDDNGAGTEEQMKTQAILQPFIDDKKIIYIVHDVNKNGSAARNTGFRAAKGEFVTFLDDDDVILPTKLEKQLALMNDPEAPADVVICGSYFVHEDGRGIAVLPKWDPKHIQRDYLRDKMHFNTSAILLRKEAVERIGGFDESFRRHQDWEFCIRLMDLVPFSSVNERLVIKYATGRNMASNPQKAVDFYDHFQGKMAPYFSKLEKADQKAIGRFQNKRLMKTFIFSRDFAGLRGYMRSGKIGMFALVGVFFDLVFHVMRRFTKGNQKHTDSWASYMEKAIEYFKKEA